MDKKYGENKRLGYCLFLNIHLLYLSIYLFYLYIYPPDSQESDGSADT